MGVERQAHRRSLLKSRSAPKERNKMSKFKKRYFFREVLNFFTFVKHSFDYIFFFIIKRFLYGLHTYKHILIFDQKRCVHYYVK